MYEGDGRKKKQEKTLPKLTSIKTRKYVAQVLQRTEAENWYLYLAVPKMYQLECDLSGQQLTYATQLP